MSRLQRVRAPLLSALLLPNLNRFPPRKSNRKRQSPGLRCPSCTQSTAEQRVSLCGPLGASVRTRRVQASGMWSVHGNEPWSVAVPSRFTRHGCPVACARERGFGGARLRLGESRVGRGADPGTGSGAIERGWSAARGGVGVAGGRRCPFAGDAGEAGVCAAEFGIRGELGESGRRRRRAGARTGRSWTGRGGMKRWLGADSTRRVMWCVREVGAYSGAGRHREAVTGVMGGDVGEAGLTRIWRVTSGGSRMQWVGQRSKSDAGGCIPRSRRAREIVGGRRARGVDRAGVVDGRRAVPLRHPSALADTSRLERPARWRTRATRRRFVWVEPPAEGSTGSAYVGGDEAGGGGRVGSSFRGVRADQLKLDGKSTPPASSGAKAGVGSKLNKLRSKLKSCGEHPSIGRGGLSNVNVNKYLYQMVVVEGKKNRIPSDLPITFHERSRLESPGEDNEITMVLRSESRSRTARKDRNARMSIHAVSMNMWALAVNIWERHVNGTLDPVPEILQKACRQPINQFHVGAGMICGHRGASAMAGTWGRSDGGGSGRKKKEHSLPIHRARRVPNWQVPPFRPSTALRHIKCGTVLRIG
ncbi:hypothetical protein B0H10DRAFT_1962654 [Mycena sp. CBHHK59/15]|nr:hypothetical protein B0H10DRAFT_1962654 [Mycena sp. CBHHK59/15]